MKKRPIDPKADGKFAEKFLNSDYHFVAGSFKRRASFACHRFILGGTGAGMTCWSLWEVTAVKLAKILEKIVIYLKEDSGGVL